MAADVEEFIQQHKLRLPTLIGHSMSASTLCVKFGTKLKARKGRKSCYDGGIAITSTCGSLNTS